MRKTGWYSGSVMSFQLFRTAGMQLQPSHILSVWVRDVGSVVHLLNQEGGHRRSILPLVNFSVAVGKRKTAGEIMVNPGHVLSVSIRARIGRWPVTGIIGHVVAPVDMVRAHIKE